MCPLKWGVWVLSTEYLCNCEQSGSKKFWKSMSELKIIYKTFCSWDHAWTLAKHAVDARLMGDRVLFAAMMDLLPCCMKQSCSWLQGGMLLGLVVESGQGESKNTLLLTSLGTHPICVIHEQHAAQFIQPAWHKDNPLPTALTFPLDSVGFSSRSLLM